VAASVSAETLQSGRHKQNGHTHRHTDTVLYDVIVTCASAALTLAPHWTRSCMTSLWPIYVAQWRGVRSLLSATLTLAPSRSNNCTICSNHHQHHHHHQQQQQQQFCMMKTLITYVNSVGILTKFGKSWLISRQEHGRMNECTKTIWHAQHSVNY